VPLVNAAQRVGIPRGKWHTRSPELNSGRESPRRIHTVSATSSDLGGCCAEWDSGFEGR
jgi:hypothetical protein